MASNARAEWAMDVVMVCRITPPRDVLRRAVDEVCGSGCGMRYDDERPVITVEGDARDGAEAVAVLNSKAQRLVERLSQFDCGIELTTRLENRYVELETPEAPSLGEGS